MTIGLLYFSSRLGYFVCKSIGECVLLYVGDWSSTGNNNLWVSIITCSWWVILICWILMSWRLLCWVSSYIKIVVSSWLEQRVSLIPRFSPLAHFIMCVMSRSVWSLWSRQVHEHLCKMAQKMLATAAVNHKVDECSRFSVWHGTLRAEWHEILWYVVCFKLAIIVRVVNTDDID